MFKRKKVVESIGESNIESSFLKEGGDTDLAKRRTIDNKIVNRITDDSNISVNDLKFTINSDMNPHSSKDNLATATLEYDTEKGKDARTLFEKDQEIAKKILKGELDRSLYHGRNAQKLVSQQKTCLQFKGVLGPMRGQQHMRINSVMDYQPDLCKDFKETGYCGWGDTCIFLHDRSSFKSGWQIDRDWEETEKLKKARREEIRMRRLQGEEIDFEDEQAYVEGEQRKKTESDLEDEKDNLPFACWICRKPWTVESEPVSTLCGHFFCEKCAFMYYSKCEKCATCGKPTKGIFNEASRVKSRLLKRAEKNKGTRNCETLKEDKVKIQQ